MTKTMENMMTRKVVPAGALVLMDKLNAAGYDTFLVGGCVRDAMLGDTPHDWDLTTAATPDEMKEVLADFRALDTGLKHGTVTFMVETGEVSEDGKPELEGFEVTTFRVDGDYSDGRHPDDVTFTRNVEEDLARRDFTVNAMAWNDVRGLVDPFGGAEDLANGVLRGVGNAVDRFHEDGLRVMRAVRFAAVKNLDMDEDTARAVHDCVDCLEPVSRERVATELLKLMAAENAEHLSDVLDEFRDVVFAALPEMAVTENYDQGNKHHNMDLWNHCLAVCVGVPNKPLLRLAGLLHDVGKPEVRTEGDDGNAHYFGHMVSGAKLAEKACRRLKMSNEDTEYVRFLVSVHDYRPNGDSVRNVRRFYARFGGDEELMRDCIDLIKSDILAHTPGSTSNRMDKLESGLAMLDEVKLEMNALKVKDLNFGGEDLKGMGYAPGPLFSKVLNKLLSEVVDGELPNEYEALAKRGRKLASNYGRDLPNRGLTEKYVPRKKKKKK